MSAVYVTNITINGGTDFSQVYELEDSTTNAALNLSGYSVKSEMRKHPSASGVTTFTSEIFSESTGRIKIGLSTSQTAALKEGRYVYDVVITDPYSVMSRVVEGTALVSKGVTR
jgi:hypothetical protein